MINEEFDDDIPDETVDEVTEAFDASEPGATERPAGQYMRVLAGREIWFKPPIPGQFNAFRRFRESLASRYTVIATKVRKNPSVEGLDQLREIAEKIDMSTLEFFEALLADPQDADFIAMEMIGGRVTIGNIHDVMFNDPTEPEDDVAPAVKSKPVRKQPAAKKAANAKRVRK